MEVCVPDVTMALEVTRISPRQLALKIPRFYRLPLRDWQVELVQVRKKEKEKEKRLRKDIDSYIYICVCVCI